MDDNSEEAHLQNNNSKGGGIMVNFGLDQRQHAAGYTCNWTVHLRILGKAGEEWILMEL